MSGIRQIYWKAAMALFLLVIPQLTQAHEVRPAYLEIREVKSGQFEILWKVPGLNGVRLNLRPVLPTDCQDLTPSSLYMLSDAIVERWTIACGEEGLAGQTITIEGLSATLIDVLLRVELADGRSHIAILRPKTPSYIVPVKDQTSTIVWTYLRLGVEHILGGIDHLLFVLGLLLIVRGRWRLFKTVTAFTVAHSVTLGMAVLGFVHVPPAPVEAVIALSILFLASQLAQSRAGRPGLTEQYPWLVALTFGLLHGFGFAGALSQVGLPQTEIPLALLLFNVGVELGQVMFIVAVLGVTWGLRHLRVAWPAWSYRVPAYGIGTAAAFWCIQRITAF